jgi:hypothetical protein
MIGKFALAAAMSLSAGFAAHAQSNTPAAAPPAAGAPPATAPGAAAATGLKSGMVVKDQAGAMIGTISQLGQTPDGQAAAMLNVDGQQIGILASSLTVDPSGAAATSAYTKAQLLAAAAAPKGAAKPPG